MNQKIGGFYFIGRTMIRRESNSSLHPEPNPIKIPEKVKIFERVEDLLHL